MTIRTGAQLVVETLEREGVRTVFCVPGESYLGVLDALFEHRQIQLISNRHEGGAAFMAEGYGKASGEVGVCMATRGVGASNLAIGLHTAYQDSTPLVALIGQIERPFKGKEAFQEVDLSAWFSHICKWSVEIDDAARIPELLHRAFHVARSGRPGPVVVALPHDMLEDRVQDADKLPGSRIQLGPPRASDKDLDEAVEALMAAERPVIIAGGGVLRTDATNLLVQLAEQLELPVVTAFRRFDAFPNTHRCYAGWLGFGPSPTVLEYIRAADLVIALGTRFSQVTAQDYQLLKPGARLLHVDIDPAAFGKVYRAMLPIQSDVRVFLECVLVRLNRMESEIALDFRRVSRRANLVAQLHAAYESFSTPPADYRADCVDLDGLMHDLVPALPKDAILTSDAGNFFGWICRYYRFNQPTTYIGPTSGAMGYGLPAAIGAKLAHPSRLVVAFSGDGGFMMTMQELETAVRCQVPVIAVVVNNNLYGTIRAHQERHFPGRAIGTALSNPNFAEVAKLFGCHGERVSRNVDFLPALQRAVDSGRPALIEVLTDPALLSVNQPKGETRGYMG